MIADAQAAPELSKQRSDVSIRLLGRFEVQVQDKPVLDPTFSHSKARALVKLLALQDSHSLHREKVYDLLWPELDQKAASNNLRQTLHRLRVGLADGGLEEPLAEVEGDNVTLCPGLLFDTDEFCRLAERASDVRTNGQLYREALSAYTGDLLPDDLYEDWTEPSRTDIRELRNDLLLEYSDLLQLLGDKQRAEAQLVSLLGSEPLHAPANRRLMTLYALDGRRNRAIEHFQNYAKVLERRLEVKPTAETQALVEDIRTGDLSPGVHPPLPVGAFVGRESEMKEVRAGVEAAFAGKGRLLLVSGDAGMGKTRTAEEASMYTSLLGGVPLWGRCYEGDGAPPYWPWIQIVRSYAAASSSGDFLEDLGTGVADIARIVQEVSPLAVTSLDRDAGPDEAVRFSLFDSMTSLLKAASRRRAVTVILDDLHWADQSTLDLFRFFTHEMRNANLLLIGTYREEELDSHHPLSMLLVELYREAHCFRVPLNGFDMKESLRLIESMNGAFPSEVAEAIHEGSQGNPLYTRQITELLRVRDSDGAALVTGTLVPKELHEVLARRLDALSEDCVRTLMSAAVVGRDFAPAVLELAADVAGEKIRGNLDEAVAAGIIAASAVTAGTYSFTHYELRQRLYNDLSAADRAALNGKVGEAIEQVRGQDLGPFLPQLAHHFCNAGPEASAKALEYSRRAGADALERTAYDEAALYFQTALNAAGSHLNDASRADLLKATAAAHKLAGNQEAAEHCLQEAAELAG